MGLKDMFNEADKLTTKQEKEFIKKLNKEYDKAYKSMKSELEKYIAKMETGKFTESEMMKFDRLKKLTKNLEDELKRVESLQTNQIKTFLKDTYELNYYHTGYALENVSGAKLNWTILDRKQVAQAIDRPLMNIALDKNKRRTREAIRSALTQSVVKGEGIRETAAGIRRETQMSANRALRITQTETTGIMGKAREQGFEKAERNGLQLQKEWVATLDDRTRDRHADIDGERVPTDKPFSNGLMYPGDQGGPSEEVVNCRCTHVAYIPEAEQVDSFEYDTYDDWKKKRL
jgi:SPP1 gp7 family putative phage head morphogenesis protein